MWQGIEGMSQEAPVTIVTRIDDLIPRVAAMRAETADLAAARDRFIREFTSAITGEPAYPDPGLVQEVERLRDAWEREMVVWAEALAATVTVVEAATTGQMAIEQEATGTLPRP
jgi:hypothetical protein